MQNIMRNIGKQSISSFGIMLVIFNLICINIQSENKLPIQSVAFSPTGDNISIVMGDDYASELFVYNLAKDTLIQCSKMNKLVPWYVREAKFSPDGNKIAIIGSVNARSEIYMYLLRYNKFILCTDPGNITNDDLLYKTNLNWCDASTIIYLSKQDGMVQQYKMNLGNLSVIPYGKSNSNETFLNFSIKNQEAIYIAGTIKKEPAIYRRKADSEENIQISKSPLNHAFLNLSDDENYVYANEMPELSACIYDLRTEAKLKLKTPKSNVHIYSMHEKDTSLLYVHTTIDEGNKPTQNDIILYNYLTHSKKVIASKIDYLLGVSMAPNGKYIAYSEIILKYDKAPEYTSSDTRTYEQKDRRTTIYYSDGRIINMTFIGNISGWSPDSKYILCKDDFSVSLYNIETGKIKYLVK